MTAVPNERPDHMSLTTTCRTLGLNPSTVHARSRTPLAKVESAQRRSQRAAHNPAPSPRLRVSGFRIRSTARPTALPEQGKYLCPVRTMHRILQADEAQGKRRPQRPAPHPAVPHLFATQPHEVETWAIAKLPTRARGQSLSLSRVLAPFSCYLVAWLILRKANSPLAQQLMEEAFRRYSIEAGQVILHPDRNSPMIARRANRQQALDAQYTAHPECFVQDRPIAAMPPETVATNPVQPVIVTEAKAEAGNFPTLPAARDRRKSISKRMCPIGG